MVSMAMLYIGTPAIAQIIHLEPKEITANVTWQEYDNTWTHFAVVNNSSTLSASLYINGKLTGYAAYRNPTTNLV
jgi:hypothetical protein